MKIKMLFVLLSVFCAITSEAQDGKVGLFAEPALTYELGNTAVNYPSPLSNSTGRLEGFGFGGRLGMHINEEFFVGLDGRYSMPKFTDSSVGYDARATSTNLGPVVGLQMPNLGLRVWASYIFFGELNPEKSGDFDVKFQNGSGYRLGAGFRVGPVSLNIEYQQMKYAQANLEQLGPFTLSNVFESVNSENKAWVASVSFPLESPISLTSK